MRYFIYLLFIFCFLSIYFTVNVNGQEKGYVPTISKDGVQRIKILAGNYFFSPDYIVLKVNLPVEIKIKKEAGITPHQLVIKAPEAGIDISESISTEPKIIKFTPLETGKYPFYCNKKLMFSKSHREKGMEGILEVIQ